MISWTIPVSPNKCSLSCPPRGLWPSLLSFPHFDWLCLRTRESRKLPGFEANEWLRSQNSEKVRQTKTYWKWWFELSIISLRFPLLLVVHPSLCWKRHRDILRLGFGFFVPNLELLARNWAAAWSPQLESQYAVDVFHGGMVIPGFPYTTHAFLVSEICGLCQIWAKRGRLPPRMHGKH